MTRRKHNTVLIALVSEQWNYRKYLFYYFYFIFSTVQFNSVAQWCPPLCDPMDCCTPGFPVYPNSRSLLKLMSIESVISQPSQPLLSPFPPAFHLSQHQGLFQWASSSHQVAKVLEFQLQHPSFQWIFRVDFL